MELVVLKGSVKLPGVSRALVKRGHPVPHGSLPSADVARLLQAGVLGIKAEPVAEASGLPPTKGRWCRDPASLAGLSVRELLAAVAAIDPDCPVLHGGEELGEAALVQLLTADFDPAFRLPEQPASVDKVRPAEPTLARARARAKGV